MQIKNFPKIEFLTEFELTKHADEHSRLNFSASITDTATEKFFGRVGKIISVTTDDNTPVFFGRVEAVEAETSFGASRIRVSCVSLSILADEKPVTRIFHNPDKKISDVLSTERLSAENFDLKLADEFKSKKYSPVVLQNQETNFQFILRLTKTFGQRLWLVDTMQPTSFVVDFCVHKAARKIISSQIISARRVKVGKQFKIFLKTKMLLLAGQVVTVEGIANEFVIVGVKILLEHDTFTFSYELEEKIPVLESSDAPILAKTVKLHAKIKSVDDPKNLGRVQVTFDDKYLKDMDENNPLLIPWRTPYAGKSGGIVFIPDVGDAVEVFFTNEEVFCASAVRENPLDAECQKVVEKYIGNNTRRRIFFREKSLELRSAENSVAMDDRSIKLTVAKNSIVMDERSITLTVGKNSVVLNEQGILLATADGKFSLNKDAAFHLGGKFETKSKDAELHADGKVKVDGNEISVDGKTTNVKADSTLKLSGDKVELC